MSIKTPFVAVDGIVMLYDSDESFRGIILIERKNPPHGIALPGGFVDIGESCENALVREMKEEISLDVQIIRLLGVYSDLKEIRAFIRCQQSISAKHTENPKQLTMQKNILSIFLMKYRRKSLCLIMQRSLKIL